MMYKPTIAEFEKAMYKAEFRELFPLVKRLLLSLSQGVGCVKCREKNIKNAYRRVLLEYPEIISSYFEKKKADGSTPSA